MSEKIDMQKLGENWVGFFVFEALGQNHNIMAASQDYDPFQVDAKLTYMI
ncbi:hypothetical protein [Brevibacillus daliensis]|nr:hypothetical protein [Brevibacillus daliensis]